MGQARVFQGTLQSLEGVSVVPKVFQLTQVALTGSPSSVVNIEVFQTVQQSLIQNTVESTAPKVFQITQTFLVETTVAIPQPRRNVATIFCPW